MDADASDISDTLAGDGDAYRRIIERHQDEIAQRLRKFARAGDRTTLEQLVHDTFVEAYFSLHRYRGDAPLIHWLHRIAVRVGYRQWKSQKAQRATLSIQDHDVAAKSKESNVDTDRLHQVLEQLSPRDRLVVTLMYLEDRSVEETAKLTGWSKTMVKVQAFRAREKLKKMLLNHEWTRMDANK